MFKRRQSKTNHVRPHLGYACIDYFLGLGQVAHALKEAYNSLPLAHSHISKGESTCSEAARNCCLKYLVVLGSVREGRIGDRVCKLVKRYLEEKRHTVEVLDPEIIKLPLLKQPLHFYPDQSKAPKLLHELNAKVLAADALIIITAEYNRQLPPALTNLLDHLPPASYGYRVSGIVSYSMGPFGGTIAANNARSYLTELGCLPVPFFFAIPEAHKAIDENGKPQTDRMASGLDRLINQTNWWAMAAKNQRSFWGVPSS